MSLDNRILHLSLDVTVIPPQGGEMGETDAAEELGRKLSLEIGLLAQRLAPGCRIEIERQIIVY